MRSSTYVLQDGRIVASAPIGLRTDCGTFFAHRRGSILTVAACAHLGKELRASLSVAHRLASEQRVLIVGEDELVTGDTGVLAGGHVRRLRSRCRLRLRRRFRHGRWLYWHWSGFFYHCRRVVAQFALVIGVVHVIAGQPWRGTHSLAMARQAVLATIH
jgi:hypothetical protein